MHILTECLPVVLSSLIFFCYYDDCCLSARERRLWTLIALLPPFIGFVSILNANDIKVVFTYLPLGDKIGQGISVLEQCCSYHGDSHVPCSAERLAYKRTYGTIYRLT